MPTKRIVGIQTNVDLAEPQKNLDRMVEWLGNEQVKSADLVVFPECMMTGYCFNSLDEAMPNAQSLDGPASERMIAAAKDNKTAIAYGFLERSTSDSVYNSCVLVNGEGIVGVYRKIHLPFLGVDRFTTEGIDAYAVHDIDGLRVGMHICYDGSFPESSRAMALLGADLLILPTNWPPGADTFAKYLPNARALENNVYFMSVNRVGTERGFRFIGCSRLCDVSGNPIDEANHENEAIIVGEIDVDVARSKRIVRVPKAHIIDRFADRRPEHYGELIKPHGLPKTK
jgi:predicted amidohydrolase